MAIVLTIFSGLISLFTFQSGAFAFGREAGNGGDALVCRKGESITSVQFFDVYEGKRRGLGLSLGKPEVPPKEKVRMLLEKFAQISPNRARIYLKWLETFNLKPKDGGDVHFLEKGETLLDINDTGRAIIPKDCVVEQLIIYQEPRFKEDGDYLYTVNSDLFSLLDNDNIAAAILHEFVYREFSGIAFHINSINARYYNEYLISQRIFSLGALQLLDFHRKTSSGYLDLRGMLLQVSAMRKPDVDNENFAFEALGWHDSAKSIGDTQQTANAPMCEAIALPDLSFLVNDEVKPVRHYASRGDVSDTNFYGDKLRPPFSFILNGFDIADSLLVLMQPFWSKPVFDIFGCEGMYAKLQVRRHARAIDPSEGLRRQLCSMREDLAVAFSNRSGTSYVAKIHKYSSDYLGLSVATLKDEMNLVNVKACIAPLEVQKNGRKILESNKLAYEIVQSLLLSR